jgi:hypothetical protein
MTAGENEPRAAILDTRLWSAVIGVCMLLGGWWLQNQYNTLLGLQDQVREMLIFVDGKYVDKELLQAMSKESEKRLDRIDNNLIEIKRQIDTLARSSAAPR